MESLGGITTNSTTVTQYTTTITITQLIDYNYYHAVVQDIVNKLVSIEVFKINVLKTLMSFPVSRFIIQYIKQSHQNDPYRTLIEVLLIVGGVLYFNKKNYKQQQQYSAKNNMSSKEVQQLIDEWQPEPLVDELDESYDKWKLDTQPILLKRTTNTGNSSSSSSTSSSSTSSSSTSSRTKGEHNYRDVEYKKQVVERVYNAANFNFLNYQNDADFTNKIKTTLKNYGVGACGPAGFYGNEDVHYNLEYDLAKYFGTENAVLYGQDFCVAASVLSTFNKRGDVIVADNMCSVAIQNALQLSRASIYYYQHNDMNSLETILNKIDKEEKALLPHLSRKFIVTEGIFLNNGTICKFPELVALKHKYKFRLFVDETLSLGTLGKTGRGLAEHFGFPNRSNDVVDITIGSMATAFGSSGGFALGDNTMSFFQRIGSNAYCFSASLPPYCCVAVSENLKHFDKNNELIVNLQKNTEKTYQLLKKRLLTNSSPNGGKKCQFVITSSPLSSMIIIKMNESYRKQLFNSNISQIYESLHNKQTKLHNTNIRIEEFNKEEQFLQKIVEDLLLNYKIMIALSPHSLQHETLPVLPSLTVTANAATSEEELEYLVASIGEVLEKHS